MIGAICLAGCGQAASNESNQNSTVSKVENNADSDQVVVTCKDVSVVIEPEELEEEAEVLNLIGEGTAQEMAEDAVNAVIEREVLYQFAEEAGYETSDKEFDEYTASLLNSMEYSENKDQVREYYEVFGGLVGYIDMMEDQLRKNLSISKLLELEGISADEILDHLSIRDEDRQKLVDLAKQYIEK